MKNKQKLIASIVALSLVVCGTLGYVGYKNSVPNHKVATQAKKDVHEYLDSYSDYVKIDTQVMADGSDTEAGEIKALSRDDIAALSDTVYTTIQTTYDSNAVSDEMLDYLKAQIYTSIYNQLYDKASSDVINNVYENVIAICLDDLYAYADNQDAILKNALDAAMSDLANNLLDVTDRVDTAEKDYETLDLMFSEFQADNEADMNTMLKFYQALQNSMDSANSQIDMNKASVTALEAANKDTADKLNSLITSDLSSGNDNKALSAAAGKTLLETMVAYYQDNTDNLSNLKSNVDSKTKAINTDLEELYSTSAANQSAVNALQDNTTAIRSELEKLMDELNSADDATINNTINNINNQLTQLLQVQNKDVNEMIDYLQGLLNTADEESKVLIQQLILELSKVQSKNDENIVTLLGFINKAQTSVTEEEFEVAINSIKNFVSNLQVSSPDIYMQISEYLEAIYAGDMTALNKVYSILSSTLIEHNASLGDVLQNIINTINNSNLSNDATFLTILEKIKALQSGDTTSMQNSIYASLVNLYNALGSSTETMYAAINASVSELSKAHQNVANKLTAVENDLSDQLAYTYYLLSNDLKLTNEELTNDIYSKYLELVEADTVYNNALLDELNAVNTSLMEQNSKTRDELNADLIALGQALSEADTAQLEALKQADEDAYNALIARLTQMSTELQEADSRNLAALEKANSDSYSDLLSQLTDVNKSLTDMSEENLKTLRDENETAYNALNTALGILRNDKDANVADLQKALATLNTELSTSQDEAYTDLLGKLTVAEKALNDANKATDKALRDDLAQLSSDLTQANADSFNTLTNQINSVNSTLEAANTELARDLSTQLMALGQNLTNADANNRAELLQQLADAKATLESANNDSYNTLIGKLGDLHTELSNAQNEDYERLIGQLGDLESSLTSNAAADKSEVLASLANVKAKLEADDAEANAQLISKLTKLQDDLETADENNLRDLVGQLADAKSELSKAQSDDYADLIDKLGGLESSLTDKTDASKAEVLASLASVKEKLEADDAAANADMINKLTQLQDDLSNADKSNLNNMLGQLTSVKNELAESQNADYVDLIGKLGGLEGLLNETNTATKEEILANIALVKSQLEADDASQNAQLIAKLTQLGSDLEAADESNMRDLVGQLSDTKSELIATNNATYTELVGQLTTTETQLKDKVASDKQELQDALSRAVEALEKTDSDNKFELVESINGLAADLDTEAGARLAAIENLDTKVNAAKAELEASDTANKAELISSLDNLSGELGEESTARKAEIKTLDDKLKAAKAELEASDLANKNALIQDIDDLSADLADEIAGRTEANASLLNKLDTTKNDLTTSIAGVSQNVSDEAAARSAAITSLDNKLAAAKAELAQSDATNKAALTASLNSLSDDLSSESETRAADKAALESSIATLKTNLEASDSANKTELLNKVNALSTELKNADVTNKKAVENSIASVKSALEASDASNKAALVANINSVDTALKAEISKQVGLLAKADTDNLATLKSADATLRTDLLALAETQSSNKSANDTKNTAQDSAITEIKNKNTAQDSTISSIQSKDSAQDSSITSIQNKNTSQDSAISAIQSKDSAQDTKLSSLETAINKAQSKADQAFQFASDGKESIANAVTGRGVNTNADMTFAELASSIDTIGDKANATSGTMLQGTKAYVDGNYVDGSIVKQTAISKTLNAGQSVDIPAGYYATAGKVAVATLASQTSADATAAHILSGKTAYVNGVKLTGSMTNNGAVVKTLTAGQSYTIPAGYHNGSGTVAVKSLSDLTSITTNGATAAQILKDKQAYVNGVLIKGTMTDNGAKTSTLNAGGTYTIPAGYHNGSGKITAATLASQTSANATAAQILTGKTAWVNGTKITGTMANQGAVSQSLGVGGSYTIPAGYHNGSGKVTVGSLASVTSATAAAGDILSGKTAYVNGTKITGTMTNQGAKTSTINAGGSYTIPAGYHNGSGKITAATLASQTSGTAAASNILSGKTAWVNGTKITGTMKNNGAVNKTVTIGSPYTVPAGYHDGTGKVNAVPYDPKYFNLIGTEDLELRKIKVKTTTFNRTTNSSPNRNYDEVLNSGSGIVAKFGAASYGLGNYTDISAAANILGLYLSGASKTSGGTKYNRSCCFLSEIDLNSFKKASLITVEVACVDDKYADSNNIKYTTKYTTAMVHKEPTFQERYTTYSGAGTDSYTHSTESLNTGLKFTISKIPNSYKVIRVESSWDMYDPYRVNSLSGSIYTTTNYIHAFTSRCEVDTTTNTLRLYIDSNYEDDSMRYLSALRKDVSTVDKAATVHNWYAENSETYAYLGKSDDNAYAYYAAASIKKLTFCDCPRPVEECSACNKWYYNNPTDSWKADGYKFIGYDATVWKTITYDGDTYEYQTRNAIYAKGADSGEWESVYLSPRYYRAPSIYSTGTISYFEDPTGIIDVSASAYDVSVATEITEEWAKYHIMPYDPLSPSVQPDKVIKTQ